MASNNKKPLSQNLTNFLMLNDYLSLFFEKSIRAKNKTIKYQQIPTRRTFI